MILLILAAITLIIIAFIKHAKHEEIGPYDVIFTLISLFTALMFASTISSQITPVFNTTPSTTQNLTSLKAENGVEGQFFLGSGTVKSTPVYFYYQLNVDRTYSLKSQDAEYSYIRETSTTPQLEVYTPKIWFDIIVGPSHNKYVFDVPQGSVISSYNPNP